MGEVKLQGSADPIDRITPSWLLSIVITDADIFPLGFDNLTN